jgi:hypothetical protein
MSDRAADNYPAYFSDKLWNLLPAVYRVQDTDQFGANGPVREMVNRIGSTAAEIRRNIDRLWEDQSIETCDDWVIPYIADLVDTRLVGGLDGSRQRIDVANTIDYRRRKGTLGILEQIAADITGWDAKAVEFFRRLARTRHGLDPPVGRANYPGGDIALLLQAEGLIGYLTQTPIGGFANLRNVNGAAKVGTAFDEFFHTADTRRGLGKFGWHAIPHLGVFVWRLVSLGVGPVTPVPVRNCPGWYCFDPTGRDVPLFAAKRDGAAFGGAWVSPVEGQLPAPISQTLLDADVRTPEVDGPNQTGALLKTKRWGTTLGSLPNVGDVYTIDGVFAFNTQTSQSTFELQQFVITAPASTDSGGRTTLSIYPPISPSGPNQTVTGSPADNATINPADAGQAKLYPAVISVLRPSGSPPSSLEVVPASALKLRPARGRFGCAGSPPATMPVASYHYGFPSLIGAGPFDRRGQEMPIPTPAPPTTLSGGGPALANLVVSSGTVTLADSLTYDGSSPLHVAQTLTLRAGNKQRPLVRLAKNAPWIITGTTADASLTLDGLFISGNDIVLRGTFASVSLACCTLDPGSAPMGVTGPTSPPASPPTGLFQISADGRDLVPTCLRIEAAIASLTIDRCVVGPIRTQEIAASTSPPSDPVLSPQGAGYVETISICNSVVQAIRTTGTGPIHAGEVQDPLRLLRQLQLGLDPVSAQLRKLDHGIATLFGAPASPPLNAPPPAMAQLQPLLNRLNTLISGPPLYSNAFAAVPLSAISQQLRKTAQPNHPAPELNRALLEDAYPLELSDAALAFGDGMLSLSRCTVLGRIVAHQLQASDCILQQLAVVNDRQDGCVRFTAWAEASLLPRQYESVSIRQSAPLFTTTDFGQPGYAQLLATADLQRLPQTSPDGTPPNTITAGAADGSEMGAYARDKNPIRAQALMLKLQEYMPAGLTPVIVNVT